MEPLPSGRPDHEMFSGVGQEPEDKHPIIGRGLSTGPGHSDRCPAGVSEEEQDTEASGTVGRLRAPAPRGAHRARH